MVKYNINWEHREDPKYKGKGLKETDHTTVDALVNMFNHRYPDFRHWKEKIEDKEG